MTQFNTIWPKDRTLSGATTPGQIGPGSDENKGLISILQRSGITEASQSDCLVSYPRHWGSLIPLQRCSVFWSPSWLGQLWVLWSTPLLALLPGQLWRGMLISFIIQFVVQIDLFKNKQYSTGLWAKKKKKIVRDSCTKNVLINVPQTRFPNVLT